MTLVTDYSDHPPDSIYKPTGRPFRHFLCLRCNACGYEYNYLKKDAPPIPAIRGPNWWEQSTNHS